MSIATKSDNTKSTVDNKALFGPLGKYAIVGVMMGSVIVTTAIMLDKQPGSQEQLAALEKEVAEMNADVSNASADTTSATETVSQPLENTNNVETVQLEAAELPVAARQTDEITVSVNDSVEQKQVAAADEHVALESVDTVVTVEEMADVSMAPVNKQLPADEQLASMMSVRAETVAIENDQPALPQQAIVNDSVQNPLPRYAINSYDQEWQTRIDARDLEYKQHMTKYFDRIKSRESENLEQYRKHQNEHIEFLRDKITRQEKLIEELILRNEEYYDKREASMQRRQSRRESILNRI